MNHKVTDVARTLGIATLVALVSACASRPQPPAPPPSYASYFDQLPCVDRIGRCFDASIAGQPVVVIADKARHQRISAEARQGNSQVREVYWEVTEPVDGKRVFEVAVGPNALGQPHVGAPAGETELIIYPLDRQKLASKQDLVTSHNVNINGRAAVAQQNTLTQDNLPPGRYVITIRYEGERNWERKSLYLTVK
jgi:hypothetical protein